MPYPLASTSEPSRVTPTAQPGDRTEAYGAKMESTQRDAESGVCAPATAAPTETPRAMTARRIIRNPLPNTHHPLAACPAAHCGVRLADYADIPLVTPRVLSAEQGERMEL